MNSSPTLGIPTRTKFLRKTARGKLGTTALTALVLLCGSRLRASETLSPDLGALSDPKHWVLVNAETSAATEASTTVAQLAPIGGNRKGSNLAFALVRDLKFSEGTIDVDLRGNGETRGSFLGIAFGVSGDGAKHEAVYFRPFNFRSPDPDHHAHAVQYVSWPDYPWERLRNESPGHYEKALSPAPDPAGWFHARIVISAQHVDVFVDGATEPCLSVDCLAADRSGDVGLWVDSQVGAFANLKIQPR